MSEEIGVAVSKAYCGGVCVRVNNLQAAVAITVCFYAMAFMRNFAFLILYSSLGVCFFVFFMELSTVKENYPKSALKRLVEQQNKPEVTNASRTIGRNLSIHENRTHLLNSSQVGNIKLLNATTVATATISLSPAYEPKNWKKDGYFSVRSNEVIRNCSQCAIVTSSGHLLGTKAGPEIDANECVIRMNAAPTGKYAADVGHKTTFRIIGHRNFPRMFDTEPERQLYFVNPATKSDAIVTAWLYSVNVGKNIETFLSRRYAKKYKDTQFFLTSEDQMGRNERLFYQMLGVKKPKKHLWMSTGWTTMIFALEVCDEIHVYGMTYEEYCKEHPKDGTYYHYFDKLRRACDYFKVSENKITTGHKFLTEKLSFANWASYYNITFHYPSWENHIGKDDWISPFHESYVKHQNQSKQAAPAPDSRGAVISTGNNNSSRDDTKQ